MMMTISGGLKKDGGIGAVREVDVGVEGVVGSLS